MSRKKIAITGGSGFVGTNMTLNLLQNGCCVISFDIKNPNSAVYECSESENFYFHQCNINEESFKNCLKMFAPDIIIHLAATSSVDESWEKEYQTFENNVKGTWSLLSAIENLNYKPKLVHVSTDEVYGPCLDLEKYPNGFPEDAPLNPTSPYSASKAASDMLVIQKKEDIDFAIVRMTNNYGPYQTYDKIIPKCIKYAVEGERFPIYGEGDQSRTWLWVEDSVEAILKIANFLEKELIKPGEIFNISGLNEFENKQLVNMIHEDLQFRGMKIPPNKKVVDRKNHDFRYCVDQNKYLQYFDRTMTKDFILKSVISHYLLDLKNER